MAADAYTVTVVSSASIDVLNIGVDEFSTHSAMFWSLVVVLSHSCRLGCFTDGC